MSIEDALGISTEAAMEIVERRWPDWVRTRPILRSVGVADLGAGFVTAKPAGR